MGMYIVRIVLCFIGHFIRPCSTQRKWKMRRMGRWSRGLNTVLSLGGDGEMGGYGRCRGMDPGLYSEISQRDGL